jgi:hypothetical protein
MEVLPTADQDLATPGQDVATPPQEVGTPDEDLGWRLANVEARLDAISERLGRLEVSLLDAVGAEVHGATTELRHAISELGRRLVQDLPSQLARHRDTIVAELRPPPPPPPPAPEPAVAVDADPSPGAGPAATEVDTAPDRPEEDVAAERGRSSRRLRRHG